MAVIATSHSPIQRLRRANAAAYNEKPIVRYQVHVAQRTLRVSVTKDQPTDALKEVTAVCSKTTDSNGIHRVGRDSSVGRATRYGLDGPGIESRRGRDFSHPSRSALRPTCYTMGTGSFPGVKRPGRGVALTTHPL
jgi:hypothetical protein